MSALAHSLGVSRSLTHHYKRSKPPSQSHLPVSASDNERLLGPSVPSHDLEMVSIPPVWVDKYEDIVEELDSLTKLGSAYLVRQLKDEQRRRLAISAFGDARNSEEVIENLTEEVTEKGGRCRANIEELRTYSLTRWDGKAIEAAQQSAAGRLQTLINSFRVAQQAFFTKRKQYSSHTDLLVETSEEEEGIAEFTETQVFKERNQDVSQLLQNFTTLSEIFRELNHLVVQQGNILDRIDVNIEMAVTETSKATGELKKAEEQQKSMRATCCLVWLVAGIVVLTVMLVLKQF